MLLYKNNEAVFFGSCSMYEYSHTKYSFSRKENVSDNMGKHHASLTGIDVLSEYYHWSDALDNGTRRDYCWYIPDATRTTAFDKYLSKLHRRNWKKPPKVTSDSFSLSSENAFDKWLRAEPFAELDITSFGSYLAQD